MFPFLRVRRLSLAGLLGLSVFGLTACTPAFDWRELRPDDAPMVFVMPAKASNLTREINLDGLAVKMQMFGARAGDQTFTAAWIDLGKARTVEGAIAQGTTAPSTEAIRQRALGAMQTGMLRNIGAAEAKPLERTVALIGAGGEAVGRLPARHVQANGRSADKPVQMRAIFAAFGDHLYQFVVIGNPINEHAAATFLDSVRLRATPVLAVSQ